MSKRWLSFIPTAAFTLAILAACGGEQAADEEVTRVPDAANAPATEATEAATEAADAEVTLVPATTSDNTAATPAAGAMATPMGAQPVAGGAATPIVGAMATPMAVVGMATPRAAGMATPVAAAGAGAASTSATDTVTLVAFDIGWEYEGERSAPGSPVDFSVAPGTTIELPNEGVTPHNFSVDELGISVDMPPAETVEAVIAEDAATGTYEYYCNVPGHKAAGMVGDMTVE